MIAVNQTHRSHDDTSPSPSMSGAFACMRIWIASERELLQGLLGGLVR